MACNCAEIFLIFFVYKQNCCQGVNCMHCGSMLLHNILSSLKCDDTQSACFHALCATGLKRCALWIPVFLICCQVERRTYEGVFKRNRCSALFRIFFEVVSSVVLHFLRITSDLVDPSTCQRSRSVLPGQLVRQMMRHTNLSWFCAAVSFEDPLVRVLRLWPKSRKFFWTLKLWIQDSNKKFVSPKADVVGFWQTVQPSGLEANIIC